MTHKREPVTWDQTKATWVDLIDECRMYLCELLLFRLARLAPIRRDDGKLLLVLIEMYFRKRREDED